MREAPVSSYAAISLVAISAGLIWLAGFISGRNRLSDQNVVRELKGVHVFANRPQSWKGFWGGIAQSMSLCILGVRFVCTCECRCLCVIVCEFLSPSVFVSAIGSIFLCVVWPVCGVCLSTCVHLCLCLCVVVYKLDKIFSTPYPVCLVVRSSKL